MEAHFDENDIRTLCFDLQVDYDNLPGDTKSRKIVSLIQCLARLDRTTELIDYCSQCRPNVPWGEIKAAAIQEPLTQVSDSTLQQEPPAVPLRTGSPSRSLLLGLVIGLALVVISLIIMTPKIRDVLDNIRLSPTPSVTISPTYTQAVTVSPSNAILFQEDFEGAAPEHAPGWQVRTDETGNHFYCVDAPPDGPAHFSLGSSDWQDYVVELDVMLDQSSAHGTGNIGVRVTSRFAYVYDFSESVAELNKERYSPYEREYLATTPQGLVPKKWYTVHIEAKGSDIRVAIDGESVLQATDSDNDRGGLTFGAGWGQGVCFDNIRVVAVETD